MELFWRRRQRVHKRYLLIQWANKHRRISDDFLRFGNTQVVCGAHSFTYFNIFCIIKFMCHKLFSVRIATKNCAGEMMISHWTYVRSDIGTLDILREHGMLIDHFTSLTSMTRLSVSRFGFSEISSFIKYLFNRTTFASRNTLFGSI